MKPYDEYKMLLASGMFWEFCHELTGIWEKDREQFKQMHKTLQKIRRMQQLNNLPTTQKA